MTTTTRPADTRSQLRNLMSQHTAATYAKPAATPATPAASAPVRQPPPPVRKPEALSFRISVRLSSEEAQTLEAISLETHQRLGKRLAVSEIFRIGMGRMNAHAPVTAEEVRAIREKDRRRNQRGE